MESGLQPTGITITSGNTWHQESYHQYHVAKTLLVSTVQKLLQSGRLRSGWTVKNSQLLQRELKSFRVRITKSANEVYGPDVREVANDDLVLATACGVWLAENQGPPAAGLSADEVAQLQRQSGLPSNWDARRRYFKGFW
jgi:hypothetical protein